MRVRDVISEVEGKDSREARIANQVKTFKLIRLRCEVYGPALIVTITFSYKVLFFIYPVNDLNNILIYFIYLHFQLLRHYQIVL